LKALLMAGKFYNKQESSEERLVSLAAERLGLSQLDPFDPQKKVIEYQL